MEEHLFVCPASRCTYGLTGHVTKVYVSDSNQIMVSYWSVYGDFSPTLYIAQHFVCGLPLNANSLSNLKNFCAEFYENRILKNVEIRA
jgi:hypothetical protein